MNNRKKIILSCHTRNHALRIAESLSSANSLDRLLTPYPYFKIKQLNYKIDERDVRSFYFLGVLGLIRTKIKPLHFVNFELNLFDEWAASKLKSLSGDVVHAFSGSAEKTFLEAKRLGKICVLERSCPHIAYQSELLTEESDRLGFFTPFTKPTSLLYSKMIREYEMADKILVPSMYSYNSFIKCGINRDKLFHIPLAAEKQIPLKQNKRNPNKEKTVFLTIGGNYIRKGFFYLIEAWNLMNNDSSILIIKGSVPKHIKANLKGNVIVIDKSLNLTELVNLYHRADVFCLPSIDEGFGMVVLEAMSSGLPVILSENVGASDLIENYKEGIITKIRDVNGIANSMKHFTDDPSEIAKFGAKAYKTALNYDIKKYQQRMLKFYCEL
jgi:glycosyltransferase involved in cell wall biosynthesis